MNKTIISYGKACTSEKGHTSLTMTFFAAVEAETVGHPESSFLRGQRLELLVLSAVKIHGGAVNRHGRFSRGTMRSIVVGRNLGELGQSGSAMLGFLFTFEETIVESNGKVLKVFEQRRIQVGECQTIFDRIFESFVIVLLEGRLVPCEILRDSIEFCAIGSGRACLPKSSKLLGHSLLTFGVAQIAKQFIGEELEVVKDRIVIEQFWFYPGKGSIPKVARDEHDFGFVTGELLRRAGQIESNLC